MKSHLDRALQDCEIYSQRLKLIVSSRNLFSVGGELLEEYSDGGSDDLVAKELDYPLKDKPNYWVELLRRYVKDDSCENARNWVEILGSCNGLVCISPDEGTLFLFNPCTRESKRIPHPPSCQGPGVTSFGGLDSLSVYGFGFDSMNDDYKVIQLACPAVASVYSLKTDSWRRTMDFPHEYNFSESGTFLNGAIHWVVKRENGEKCQCLIATFDLGKEVFWDMPGPDLLDSCKHLFMDFVVGVLDESLCVLHSCSQMHDDFWLMREYGVGESWARLRITISYLCIKPLCFSKNGEAVMDIDGRLVLYNFGDHTCKDLVVHGLPEGDEIEADTYIESLVSPNGYGRNEALVQHQA